MITRNYPSSISETLSSYDNSTVSFSMEFYPPRNRAEEQQLWRSIYLIKDMGALFASVTYNSGGANADKTIQISQTIQEKLQLPALAHLTTVSQTRAEIEKISTMMWDDGINNILALRGDPPGDPLAAWKPTPGGVDHAIDLVRLLHAQAPFDVAVGAFPEGNLSINDIDKDTRFLVEKFYAGAKYAITQMFFDVDDYFRLRDRVSTIAPEFTHIPILPGIMPITSVKVIEKLLKLSRTALPSTIQQRLYAAANKDEENQRQNIASNNVRDLGIEIATQMCQKLIDAQAGCLHFCTLNYTKSACEILNNLGVDTTNISPEKYRSITPPISFFNPN